MKKWVIGIALILVAAYGALPYFDVWSLAQGIKSGDRETLEAYIDWSKIRARVKEEMAAHLSDMMADQSGKGDMNASDTGKAFGSGLVAAFGPALINNMVDSYVTPSGFVNVLNRKSTGQVEGMNAVASNGMTRDPMSAVKWAFFESPTKFAVYLQPPDQPNQQIKLRFDYRVTHWEMDDFVLPAEFFQQMRPPVQN